MATDRPFAHLTNEQLANSIEHHRLFVMNRLPPDGTTENLLEEAARRLITRPDARRCLVDVLMHHWATSTSGCTCHRMKLGASWPEHIADVWESNDPADPSSTPGTTDPVG